MPAAFLVRSRSKTEDNLNDFKVVEPNLDPQSEEPLLKTELVTKFSWSALSLDQKLLTTGICMADLLSSMSLSVMAPFFPKEAEKRGISITMSGWVFGVFSLTVVFMSPIFGKLMPIFGSKFLYLTGLFFAGGCTILFGFLQFIPNNTESDNFHFLVLCFVLRIFMAVGTAAHNCGSITILSLEFSEHVSTLFGVCETFVGIGMALGPALGGVLYNVGDFLLPFVLIGSLCWCIVPINFWVLSKRNDWKIEQRNVGMTLLKRPMVIVMCIIIMMSSIVWAGLDPILEPHLRLFSLSDSLVGLVFLLISVSYAISSPFWGRLSDRVSDGKNLLIPGFFMIGTTLLFLGPLPAFGIPANLLWLNILCLALLGIFVSLTVLPTYDMLLEEAKDAGLEICSGTNGMISGIWVSMYAMGEFVGPTLGGFLMDNFGFQLCATYMAIGCFSTGVLVVCLKIIERVKECREITKDLYYNKEESSLLKNDLLCNGYMGK